MSLKKTFVSNPSQIVNNEAKTYDKHLKIYVMISESLASLSGSFNNLNALLDQVKKLTTTTLLILLT